MKSTVVFEVRDCAEPFVDGTQTPSVGMVVVSVSDDCVIAIPENVFKEEYVRLVRIGLTFSREDFLKWYPTPRARETV
jgi:hypothetical protein